MDGTIDRGCQGEFASANTANAARSQKEKHVKFTSRRTVRSAIALAAVAGLVMGAATPARAANKRMVFSPIALAIPALQGLADGVKGWGAANGWDVQIVDGNFDPSTQANGLKTVIQSGAADAIWVLAVQPAALKEVAQLAQEKGVAMLLNGTPEDYGFSSSNFPKGLSFGLIDYKTFGTKLGEMAGRCLKQNKLLTTQVIVAKSDESQAGQAEQNAAMFAALKKVAPKVKFVATIIAKEQAKAQTDLRALLTRFPKVGMVLATNDEGALGAVGAVAATKRPVKCITDGGGSADALAKVKAGKIFGSVQLDFGGDFGQTVAELSRLVGNAKTLTGKQLYVPFILSGK